MRVGYSWILFILLFQKYNSNYFLPISNIAIFNPPNPVLGTQFQSLCQQVRSSHEKEYLSVFNTQKASGGMLKWNNNLAFTHIDF